MPKARLSIDVPEGAWVGDVSEQFPDATFRVLSAFADEDNGIGIVEIETGSDIVEIAESMSNHDAIADMEVLWNEGYDALIRFETRRPMMLLAAQRSSIPVRMPFEIQNGVGTWELTTSRDRLSELSSVFESMGISYGVDYVREVRSDDLLTDKQRDVMNEALKMGFYDTPRKSSLSEVADEIGIAKSTCSEILHRAEEKIVKDFFG